MKHETILVQVKCSERLPEKSGFHLTNIVWYDSRPDTLYDKELGKWLIRHTREEIHPDFWYEEQKDKIVLSEEEFIILADKNCPDTTEEARAYLIKELEKHGL